MRPPALAPDAVREGRPTDRVARPGTAAGISPAGPIGDVPATRIGSRKKEGNDAPSLPISNPVFGPALGLVLGVPALSQPGAPRIICSCIWPANLHRFSNDEHAVRLPNIIWHDCLMNDCSCSSPIIQKFCFPAINYPPMAPIATGFDADHCTRRRQPGHPWPSALKLVQKANLSGGGSRQRLQAQETADKCAAPAPGRRP